MDLNASHSLKKKHLKFFKLNSKKQRVTYFNLKTKRFVFLLRVYIVTPKKWTNNMSVLCWVFLWQRANTQQKQRSLVFTEIKFQVIQSKCYPNKHFWHLKWQISVCIWKSKTKTIKRIWNMKFNPPV